MILDIVPPWRATWTARRIFGNCFDAILNRLGAPRATNRFRSAGKAAGVEKGLFARCRGAAQNCVAMWESPEATDDVGVQLRPFQSFGIIIGAKEPEATLLIGSVFGVLERNIEKLPFLCG